MFDAVGVLLFVIGACGLLLQWHETRTESRSRLKARTNLQLAAGRQSRNGYLQRGRLPDFLTGSDKPNKG